jgi:SM-20-related protein
MLDKIVERAKPRHFDRIFKEDDRKKIFDYLAAPGWETGWKSNQRRDAYSFLHKHFAGFRDISIEKEYDAADELKQKHELMHVVWATLKQHYLKDHTLVRCYANGMCYGMDGTVHVDARQPGNYTFIYYPQAKWSPNWGGETIFYNDEETRIEACVMPRPNSAIFFDGRQPHRANGVTRQFPGTRITLMFKTKSGGSQQPVGATEISRGVPQPVAPSHAS